ncbi:TPA: indole-3-glycerol phosphate synthase TrpC [bacterium]|nr:indole-3-glycerol phosphate synthase TrpC [bacterium]
MILDEIIVKKKEEIKRKKKLPLPKEFFEKRDFKGAISEEGINIIAEIKYGSPSLGEITPHYEPDFIAKLYENNGARALSVVSEKDFFLGDCRFISIAKTSTNLPVLRKDFIIDPWQIEESITYGSDAILLIAAAINPDLLIQLQKEAKRAGLTTIVEVHREEELKIALKTETEIIGINNRCLDTFEVDINTSLRLKSLIPPDILVISESGIKTKNDLAILQNIGINAFLIGEAFLTSRNIPQKMRELLG